MLTVNITKQVNIYYLRPRGYGFGRVCLFISQQYYSQSSEWICMKHLPDVCFRSMNNPLHFWV